MKLKSLEIEGFKSFCNKTLITFDCTVTGIVGPNGCGKSNVVDAIRWVMGEQSAKHLRGKSMDDVIFAGARDRGAASMASVELTFNTDGAQTPPQYSDHKEVSVGRKLYRSGESEYFINKQAVRLKDVKDLFLGTGVGVNAYSIIEQGSIGQMVTSKPEERRKIIEEAAGISKFQIRKEAALRKMEATTQNLLRLKDILAELERQKSSLERQAKKAEKFKIIRDELQALDLGLASVDYNRLNSRQEEILQLMKELDTKQVSSEAALCDAEIRFEEIRLILTGFEREVSDLQQSVYEWDNTLSIAENRLSNRKEDISRLDREMAEEGARHDRLLSQILETKDALDGIVSSSVNADLDFATCEENVVLLGSTYAETQSLASELFGEIEIARRTNHEASKRLIEIEGKTTAFTRRSEELSRRKFEDTEELETLTNKHRQVARLLDDVQSGLADVKQLKFTLSERTTEIATELAAVEASVEHEESELDRVKEDLFRKKSRLQSLEELERNFEGYQDGPKTVLERKRSGEIDYVLGSVADFIETDPEFEGAVSAVLGERTQCLVVNEAGESIQGASFLKQLNSGRGSFMAMTLLSEAKPVVREVVPHQTVAHKGLLSDLVRAKPGFETLKKSLFGDYVLVDCLEEAFELWQTARQPVVTFEGEVISADGILSGGSLEKTSKALLEKKREIKELSAETSELINVVKAKEEQCFDLHHKLKTLKAELDQMKVSAHEEELKITSQEKDISHCNRELEALNDRRQRLSRELLKIEDELTVLTDELNVLRENAAIEKEVVTTSEELLNAKKSEEEYYRQKLDGEQKELTEQKIRFAQAREQKSYFEKELERLCATHVRFKKDLIVSEERRILLEKRRLFNEDRVRFAEKNISKILDSKRATDDAYVAKKEEFENLANVLMEQETALKINRRENQELKDALNREALVLTEIRGQLIRLKEQAFERYQLTLDEIFRNHLSVMDDVEYADKAARADDLRGQMARAGSVNLGAIDELKEVSERFEFLNKQRTDLEESLSALEQAIQKINQTTKKRFVETFELVNARFAELFPKLFQGGEAYLRLSDPENILETGVEIIAQPPGKRLQSITLLSGGEKALTAVSLLFAIFLIKPSPFCLLDEVDAPLDDANVDRYNDIVKEMSTRTQFIVITHNKRTMQVTDALYGVTMEKSGISQLVSVNLDG